MMSKNKNKSFSDYICSSCGNTSLSWFGKCPWCQSWNTLVLQKQDIAQSNQKASFIKLTSISKGKTKRIVTGISEWDNVLGGGMVPGECILLGGEPGIGKSTLLTSILNAKKALYICGEEFPERINERISRLNIKTDEILITEETDIGRITSYIRSRDDLHDWICIVDSIQTLRSSTLEGQMGSANIMREAVSNLIEVAREKGIVMILIGHVTKGGDIAGPKLLEHLVDCVLFLEGDRSSHLRLLRSYKNRFGTTQELGVMQMTDKGFESVLTDSLFLHSNNKNKSKIGSIISGFIDGGRTVFVEVQSLVVPTYNPVPRRVVKGVDYNKTLLLLAVLKKYANLNFDQFDVFVNLVEGFETKSTSCDLSICLSLYSSLKGIPLSTDSVCIGEVSLLGEVRPVRGLDKIKKYAKKIGLTKIYSNENIQSISNIQSSLK